MSSRISLQIALQECIAENNVRGFLRRLDVAPPFTGRLVFNKPFLVGLRDQLVNNPHHRETLLRHPALLARVIAQWPVAAWSFARQDLPQSVALAAWNQAPHTSRSMLANSACIRLAGPEIFRTILGEEWAVRQLVSVLGRDTVDGLPWAAQAAEDAFLNAQSAQHAQLIAKLYKGTELMQIYAAGMGPL